RPCAVPTELEVSFLHSFFECAALTRKCKLLLPDTPQAPASPPISHDPNSKNRRRLSRRNRKRRLVRTFVSRAFSADFAATRDNATCSWRPFHFRAASASAPVERKGSQHLRRHSTRPLAGRKGMGRAAHSLERTRRPLEPKPRPARRAPSQFSPRRLTETGPRSQLSLRNDARRHRPPHHLARRPNRHDLQHA